MTDRMPQLSIGLPVYNGESFLAETLDSLLTQTYGDFELIISDNGSTDRTEEICRTYAARDKRIRYFGHEENRGGTWNFNFVFGKARGEYFKWAAHDDLCARDFLARCIEVLDRDPSVAWCHTQTKVIDQHGREIDTDICRSSGAAESENPLPGPGSDGSRVTRPHRRFRNVLLGNGSCMDISGVIRAAALRRTNLLRPYIGYEKVLIAELSLQGRCVEIPEPLFFFRVHAESASSRLTADEQASWCDPQTVGCRRLARFEFLKGYVDAVRRSGIRPYDQLCCFIWIGRYLLQISKWKRILQSHLQGTGVGGGNREINFQMERTVHANLGHRM